MYLNYYFVETQFCFKNKQNKKKKTKKIDRTKCFFDESKSISNKIYNKNNYNKNKYIYNK